MISVDVFEETGRKKIGSFQVSFAWGRFTIKSNDFEVIWTKIKCLLIKKGSD